MIYGNFNAIFSTTDKKRGTPNSEDITQAQALKHDLYPTEPPSVGRHFTWTNGQVMPPM